MPDLFEDGRRYEPHGGRARGGRTGSIHLSVRSGSRGRGASAAAAYAYVTRTGAFEDRGLDEAVHVESGHMPKWAEDRPETYWDAADLFERANGRLYVSADFALPRGLDLEDQVRLAGAFIHELTDPEQLPYTLAIHAGRDESGAPHNPHAHVLISERMNDGVERHRERWFRRANAADPTRGGAPKTRSLHGRPWMERARERWASLTNDALAARGRPERVDHRSYARQGFDREAGRHYGPAAAHLFEKGRAHDALADSAAVEDQRVQLDAIDSAISALERERAALVQIAARERGPRGGGRGGSRGGEPTPGRDDDWMPGR